MLPSEAIQTVAIRRRDAKSGTRWDVEWLLPDGTKRSKTFKTLRAAKLFDGEVRSSREVGETVDPRGAETELHVVYKSWLASRPDLSLKVRRGYEDNWRLRIEPKFGNWPIGRIWRENLQEWVNGMTAAGLGPRTVRWTHSVLRMTLDHAITDKKLRGKNPTSNVRFPAMGETSLVYLAAVEVTKLAELCDTATGEDSRAAKQGDVVLILAYTGLVRRIDRTQYRRCGPEGAPYSGAEVDHTAVWSPLEGPPKTVPDVAACRSRNVWCRS